MEEIKNSQREEKFKNIDGKDRKYHLGDNNEWIYTNWVMGGDGKQDGTNKMCHGGWKMYGVGDE